MIRAMKYIAFIAFTLGLVTPLAAQPTTEILPAFKEVVSQARAQHLSDYQALKELEALSPQHYLKARVQRPTAARALKRLKLHSGVLIEAMLRPSLDLITPQVFPDEMSAEVKAYWQAQSLMALQLGAATALAHQRTPQAESALSFAIHSDQYIAIRPTLCILYGQLARHSEGVQTLLRIAQTSEDALVQQSAIIGLGKTRLPQALEALQGLRRDHPAPHIEIAILGALGHLANKAAQKALPMKHDTMLKLEVTRELLNYLNKATPPAHQRVAIDALAITLGPADVVAAKTLLTQPGAIKTLGPLFQRLEKRGARQER